jgi:hypothetical protein
MGAKTLIDVGELVLPTDQAPLAHGWQCTSARKT